MTQQGWLTTTGWTDWATVAALIGDDRCHWTGLGPTHADAGVPASAPVGATHLWSWRPGRWVRVRFDGTLALATVLTTHEVTGAVATTFTRVPGVAWGNHSRAACCELEVITLNTDGPAPVTFAEVSAAG